MIPKPSGDVKIDCILIASEGAVLPLSVSQSPSFSYPVKTHFEETRQDVTGNLTVTQP